MIDKMNIYYNRLQYFKNNKKTNNKILYKDENKIKTNIQIDNILPKNIIDNIREKINKK
jgi:uncharacterized FAD-dependent dehydrogenase